jgi:hypothetical protein
MAARVILEGLSQFRQALRNLPEHLKDEAAGIVRGAAERAKGDVQRAYPEGPTGNLRRGVTKEEEHGRFGVSAIVKSRARHSYLYERGSNPRRTSRGANRGRMPQAPEPNRMIPIVVRHRKRMTEQLKDLVRREGFKVD